VVEQHRVVAPRRFHQPYAMCLHRQIVARLVEPDMAVAPNAEQLQVDTARRGNRCFLSIALGVQVGGEAVQKMDSCKAEIYPFKQVLLHECSKASRMAAVDAGEFVEIEGGGARPVSVARRMYPAQLRVPINRRSCRREAEYRIRL